MYIANKNIMKKTLLFMAIVLTINVNAQIAPDKQKHAIAGGLIGSSVTYFTIENSHNMAKSMAYGMVFSTAAGIGKESYDVLFCKNKFDLKDFGATMVGGFVGSALTAFLAWDEKYPYRYRTIIKMNRQEKLLGVVINF
jgi:hypothetical protein